MKIIKNEPSVTPEAGKTQLADGLPEQPKPIGAVQPGDLQRLAKDLVELNIKHFSGIFGSEVVRRQEEARRTTITRKYISKNDIRKVVEATLIPDYRREDIIVAVTDYLFNNYYMV